MRSKMEAHKDYQTIRGNYDVFLLMVTIKGMIYKLNSHKHYLHAFHDARWNFYHY